MAKPPLPLDVEFDVQVRALAGHALLCALLACLVRGMYEALSVSLYAMPAMQQAANS